MHTGLLKKGLAEFLKEETRGSVVVSSLPCLANPASDDAKAAADPGSMYPGVGQAEVTAPDGTEEWSFQITGRRRGEQ